MSNDLSIYRLERTVISQANELTDVRENLLTWVGKYNEAEKRYQTEKERSERYGGLIIAIGQVLDDVELAYEEQVTAIQAMVNRWEETEVTEV